MRDIPLIVPSRARYRRVRVALGMLVLLGIALMAGAAWLMWPGDAFDMPTAQPPADRAPAPPGPGSSSSRAPAARTPGGLTGALDPARLFDLGAAGDLQLDHRTQVALESLAAGLGPTPGADALMAVDGALRAGLPRDAAAQAIDLLRSYRAYSRAQARASSNRPPASTVTDMRTLLEADAMMRRQYFDATTAQALFGTEEAYAKYALEVQVIEADSQLSATEKARRLQALQSSLAPTPTTEGAQEVAERVATVRQGGGTEVQVQAVRMQYLRPDLAAGLGDIEFQQVALQQAAVGLPGDPSFNP